MFHPVKTPTAEQLHTLLHQIIQRIMKSLTRQGYLIEEQGMTYLADTEADAAMAPLQSAACTYRITLGPRAGQKVITHEYRARLEYSQKYLTLDAEHKLAL